MPPPIERPRTRGRLLRLAARYVAPALLVGVALAQVQATARLELSPWKGAGFGMFSTIDSPNARFLRLVLETPDGDLPVPLPARWARTLRAVQTLPTRGRLNAAARRLATSTWVVPELPRVELERVEEWAETADEEGPPWPQGITPPAREPMPFVLPRGAEALGFTVIDFDAVRVELWRYRFDAESARLEMERVRGVRMPRIDRARKRTDG